MSNIAEQVREAMESIIATELPTFSQLRYKLDVSKNTGPGNGRGFGVTAGPAVATETVTKTITLDHGFNVKLMDNFRKQQSDAAAIDVIDDLYDKHDEISKVMAEKKAGLPAIVIVVTLDSIDEPEILEDEAVLLTANYTVKYRSLI